MLKTEMTLPYGYSAEDVRSAVLSSLPIRAEELSAIEILKKTLSVTDGSVFYKLSVGFSVGTEKEEYLLRFRKKVSRAEDLSFSLPAVDEYSFDPSPIVVGAGPCGLFAALILAEAGAKPIVIERGLPVDERKNSILAFHQTAILDGESNAQFGEGGAGAFSDGKLKSGSMDCYKRKVLETFVSVGAPEEILYLVGAHLGTDKLPRYVKAIREKIVALGGSFRFATRVDDLVIREGKVTSVICTDRATGRREELPAGEVILATGHSARDTYRMLLSHGLPMQARGFGIGMRVEHPRNEIDRLIYGSPDVAKTAGTASYHLVTHLEGGRSVYSFCMCPGGEVVAATGSPGAIVTNGMSEFARNADNSNSALLVSVTPEDFASDSPLAGVELQEQIERKAFSVSGNSYRAPALRMDELLKGRPATDRFESVKPSYPLGTCPIAPAEYLPLPVAESLKGGIADFDRWMPGFYRDDAVLTGPETRSTAPVRVIRDETTKESPIRGLYPSGEGAGYAGGIVSSAVDGIHSALAVLDKHKKA